MGPWPECIFRSLLQFLVIAWIKELYFLVDTDFYFWRSSNLVEENLEEETKNNNTCGRRHSQHHDAHLS